MIRSLGFGVVVALCIVTAAWPKVLDKPTPGYIYFHLAGADKKAHDAAVRDCAKIASTVRSLPIGLLGASWTVMGTITRDQQNKVSRVHFDAVFEACMTAKGWEAIALDDEEGANLAKLPPGQISDALTPLVGAAAPRGHVVRRYQPLLDGRAESSGDLNLGLYDPDRPSLSLLSVGGDERRGNQSYDLGFNPFVKKGRPAQWRQIEPVTDQAAVLPDATVIVVHVIGEKRSFADIEFARVDDQAPVIDGVRAVTLFAVADPPKLWGRHALDGKTYVFSVPPGRWRVVEAGGVSFCLGGPEFDLAEGQAVFAGTLDAARPYALSVAPVDLKLNDAALAARLRPAAYRNGTTWNCDLLGPIYAYTLRVGVNVE